MTTFILNYWVYILVVIICLIVWIWYENKSKIIVTTTTRTTTTTTTTAPVAPKSENTKKGKWSLFGLLAWALTILAFIRLSVWAFMFLTSILCGYKDKPSSNPPPPEINFPKSGEQKLYSGGVLHAYIDHRFSHTRITGLGKNKGAGIAKYTYCVNGSNWFDTENKPTPEWSNSSIGNYNVTTDQDSVLVSWW